MENAVRQKFLTHKQLHEKLLATGTQELMENSPFDYYWGISAGGSGDNHLGRILMKVRSELAVNLQSKI